MSKDTKHAEQMAKDLDKIYGELLSVIDYDLQHNTLPYEDFYNLMKATNQIGTMTRNLKVKVYDSKL